MFLRSVLAFVFLLAVPAFADQHLGTRISYQSGVTTTITGYDGPVTRTTAGEYWLGFVPRPAGATVRVGDPARIQLTPGTTARWEYVFTDSRRGQSFASVELRVTGRDTLRIRGVDHPVLVMEAEIVSIRPAWSYRLRAWVDPELRLALRQDLVATTDATPNLPHPFRTVEIVRPR